MNFDGDESRGVRVLCHRQRPVLGPGLSYRWAPPGRDHGIFDTSPIHILRELKEAVAGDCSRAGSGRSGDGGERPERSVRDRSGRPGGHGLDGQWNDDFHHSLHALLTGERDGYYRDFGSLDHLAKAYTDGFVYDGNFSPTAGVATGRRRRTSRRALSSFAPRTTDQVGNRAWGERLGTLTDFEGQKLAATAVLLSPFVPLLFMGEEYGERAPFLFFTDFEDPALVRRYVRGDAQSSPPSDGRARFPTPACRHLRPFQADLGPSAAGAASLVAGVLPNHDRAPQAACGARDGEEAVAQDEDAR